MKRRDFLQLMMLTHVQPRLTNDIAHQLIAAAGAKPYASPQVKGKGSVFLFMKEHEGAKSFLRVFDWDTYRSTDLPIPLTLPHALVQDPTDENVVFVFETFGSFARVDLRTGKSKLLDHRLGKDMSYGHAALTGHGAIFSTEVESDRSHGVVRVRDLKDLSRIKTLPPECDGSHQIAVMQGGKLAACGVATEFGRGDKGAVTFVDCETHDVHARVELPSSISHVAPISSTEVMALGLRMKTSPIHPSYQSTSQENMPDTARTAEFESAPIFRVKTDGTFSEVTMDGHVDAFKFNFAYLDIPEVGKSVTSHLGSHRMIVWRKGRPEKIFDMPYPTNLALSQDHQEFMVVTDNKARVFAVSDLREIKVIEEDLRVVGLSAYKSVKS